MKLPGSFTPLWAPPPGEPTGGIWFVFRERELVVHDSPDRVALLPETAPGTAPLPVHDVHCIGLLGAQPCWAAQAEAGELPPDASAVPLRALFDRIDDGVLAIAGRADQVLEFHRTNRYCGACATPTAPGDGGRALHCPRCGDSFYPRLAPAMMVLVTRQGPSGRELLLARGRRFTAPIFSALAGFVEPSETLEECVHREVREEVGVRVRALRYFGSQCWPFPHSLMVAFLAEHAGGEIACEDAEIAEAHWFPADQLPPLPHRLSVARKLIEFAVEEAKRAGG